MLAADGSDIRLRDLVSNSSAEDAGRPQWKRIMEAAVGEVADQGGAPTPQVSMAGPWHRLWCRLPDDGLDPARAVVVLAEREQPGPPPPTMLRDRFRLTPREAEVALLLVQRCSNKEIARQLLIARRTADHHTENVLRKLGVHSRKEVKDALMTAAAGRGTRNRT